MLPKQMSNPRQIQQAVNAYLATFEADVVPKGWYSSAHLAKAYGCSQSNILMLLRRLAKAGKVERKDFRINGAKGLHKAAHYKLEPAAAKAFGLKTG